MIDRGFLEKSATEIELKDNKKKKNLWPKLEGISKPHRILHSVTSASNEWLNLLRQRSGSNEKYLEVAENITCAKTIPLFNQILGSFSILNKFYFTLVKTIQLKKYLRNLLGLQE